MKVPVEEHDILKSFLKDILEMLKDVEPYSRALAKDPGNEQLERKVVDVSYQMFHTIKGTGGELRLSDLSYMAEAYEYMLDRVRTGTLNLNQEQARLLSESSSYLLQNLNTIWDEKGDHFMAADARAFSDSVMLTTLDDGSAEGLIRPYVPVEGMAEMDDSFMAEVRELLERAEQEFVLWDFIALDHERIAELINVLNRLKRNFSLYEYTDLKRISQVMEATLNRFLGGELFQGEYPERIFIRAIDAMNEALNLYDLSGDAHVAEVDKHIALLQGLVRKPIGELLVKAGLVGPDVIEHALEVQKADETTPRRLGELLVEMGEVSEEDITRALDAQHKQREKSKEAEAALTGRESGEGVALREEFVLGDILLERATAGRICSLVDTLVEECSQQEGLPAALRELQEVCRPLNSASVGALIPRLKRVVHDLAVRSDKKVHFAVHGADNILDVQVVESLYEPLLHLLRNGIEHGIETPAERLACGKGKGGSLSLFFLRKKGEIWVSVEDDGRGLDVDAIVREAVEQGVLTEEQVRRKAMQSSDLAKLMFELGVVKAVDITDSSGRGVGMDAVKASMDKLGGNLDVLSRFGKGTRVTLRVPVD